MALDLLQLVQTFGPTVAIIVFFLWRDFRREDRLHTQVEKLETYQKETLENLIEKTTSSLSQSSECIKWIGRVLEHLVRVCPRIIGQNCDKPESLQK